MMMIFPGHGAVYNFIFVLSLAFQALSGSCPEKDYPHSRCCFCLWMAVRTRHDMFKMLFYEPHRSHLWRSVGAKEVCLQRAKQCQPTQLS